MHWSNLWNEFVSGDPSAISAICSVAALIVSVAGTLFILLTFRAQLINNRSQDKINQVQQTINEQQLTLNKSILERNRREIRPSFKLGTDYGWKEDFYNYSIELKIAAAYNLRFTYETFGMFTVTGEIIEEPEWQIGSRQMIRFQINSDGDAQNSNMIHIQFEDEMGRGYTQRVFWYASLPRFTIPKLIVGV